MKDPYKSIKAIPEHTPCSWPSHHMFEDILLFNVLHKQCETCGYSPTLDHDKPKYAECHEAYKKFTQKY